MNTRFTTTSVSITPFVRRYWSFQQVHLFAGAGLSVNLNSSKQPTLDNVGQAVNDGQQASLVSLSPHLEIGVNYFLTNRLSVQLAANTNSLPLRAAGLNAGLVYWTGSGRRADPQGEQANPQTDAGKWLLEGNFSVNSSTDKLIESSTGVVNRSTLNSYAVSPSVGYFIRKNSVIGFSLPVAYASIKPSSSSSGTIWTIGFSPYVQHYWTSTRLTPYTRVNVGYAWTNNQATGNKEVYTSNALSGAFSMGLAYMVGQRFIVETSLLNASVAYTPYSTSDFGSYYTTWTASISAGLTGSFAIRYVL